MGAPLKIQGAGSCKGPNSYWVIFNYRQTRQEQTPCQFRGLFIQFSPLPGNGKQNACHSPLCSSRETKGRETRGWDVVNASRVPWWDREGKAVWMVGERAVCREGQQSPKRGAPCPRLCMRVNACARVHADARPPLASVVREPHKAAWHQGIILPKAGRQEIPVSVTGCSPRVSTSSTPSLLRPSRLLSLPFPPLPQRHDHTLPLRQQKHDSLALNPGKFSLGSPDLS